MGLDQCVGRDTSRSFETINILSVVSKQQSLVVQQPDKPMRRGGFDVSLDHGPEHTLSDLIERLWILHKHWQREHVLRSLVSTLATFVVFGNRNLGRRKLHRVDHIRAIKSSLGTSEVWYSSGYTDASSSQYNNLVDDPRTN